MQRIFNSMMGFALCSCAALAAAQSTGNYPDKPIRVIVPVAAGGGTDIIARIVMSKVAEGMGATIVIDNRAGAGGILGNEIVAHSQPDGYTLLFTYAAHTIVPFIYRKVPYDVYKDFAPVTMAGSQPLLLAVNSSVKANTVQELIALAKAKPNELNVALATPSSSGALAAELFKILTNTQMVSVPFKGGAPALTALMSGEVQMSYENSLIVVPHIKAGKLHALAVTGVQRSKLMPELPTIAEGGLPGYAASGWYGFVVPAAVPKEIVGRLNADIARILRMPDVVERLSGQGAEPVGGTAEQFGAFIRSEIEKWTGLVKTANMKAD